MSLQKWLIKCKTNESNSDSDPLESLLPDPNAESTPENVKSIQAANSAVLSAIKSAGRRKRGEYSNYDSPQRAKIAKYACEHENASAVRHFAKILGKPINESTVRSMNKQYFIPQTQF